MSTAHPDNLPIHEFVERAYLDYSMYVILDRALPHLADGLKPVQRRIVYAMSELRLGGGAKPKKSARTIGDVIGKFHPHGENACYEAMVLMAQDFTSRYPLVDGQGNWGSQDDPKSFAAMRYTEARLRPYAETLLSELGAGTVDWADNFDATLKEPRLLPARLPNVLLNGGSGIAVGMATEIPPHNLREVAQACIRLLERRSTPLEELCVLVPGPDLPSGAAIVTPRAELLEIYRSGVGAVRQRACWREEGRQIVIDALPHQTPAGRVVQQLDVLIREKKVPGLAAARDESDHRNPVRIVLVPRRGVERQELMLQLYALSDLERSYRVNMNVIGMDGRPRVYGLRELLLEWVDFRTATVRRRLEHRQAALKTRLEICAGLCLVYRHLEEVVRMLREADHPDAELQQRFGLSERQAEAALSMPLRRLARLEEKRILQELEALRKELTQLEKTLGSRARLATLVKQELAMDAEHYGDARRSELVAEAPAARPPPAVQALEPVTVVLSRQGWVRAVRRTEPDPVELEFHGDDGLLQATPGNTAMQAVFIDSGGRCYALPASSLPTGRGRGEPLTARLDPPDGASFHGCALGLPEQDFLLTATDGYGYVVRLAELLSRSRSGKAVLGLGVGAHPLPPVRVSAEAGEVALASSAGHLLICPLAALPRRRSGRGVRLLALPARKSTPPETLSASTVLAAGDTLTVRTGARHVTLRSQDLEHYRGARARRGRVLPRGFRRIRWDSLVVARS